MKRLAILCSGGDCAGMNPAIKRFVEFCCVKGLEPWAIYDGLSGMVAGNLEPLDFHKVSGIVYRGGTVIRSSRCPEFRDPAARQKAADALKDRGIDALVVLGGNGSFQAMQVFANEHGIPSACIPATIDNDVPGTDYALGVDTSLNVIRHATDEIRDTASSFRRAFVVEVMGRDCGYLALVSALISGAEVCLIPEIPFDEDAVVTRLRHEMESGRQYALGVVSEGVEGGSNRVSELFQKELGFTCRVTVLGHIQRGGSPTVMDRLRAFEFVTVAMEGLLEGERNFAVLRRNAHLTRHAITALPDDLPSMSPELLQLGERLSR